MEAHLESVVKRVGCIRSSVLQMCCSAKGHPSDLDRSLHFHSDRGAESPQCSWSEVVTSLLLVLPHFALQIYNRRAHLQTEMMMGKDLLGGAVEIAASGISYCFEDYLYSAAVFAQEYDWSAA